MAFGTLAAQASLKCPEASLGLEPALPWSSCTLICQSTKVACAVASSLLVHVIDEVDTLPHLFSWRREKRVSSSTSA
jgi:hypothetical protein